MSEQIRCFFIGHRDAPESVYPALFRTVEEHITAHGVTEFVVGHYGNFDAMAARAVMDAKRQYPHVRLIRLLPYHPKPGDTELPEGFDGSWYPSALDGVPKRVAILRANRCAVENAQYLIAYAHHPASNARDLVEYARSRIPATEL